MYTTSFPEEKTPSLNRITILLGAGSSVGILGNLLLVGMQGMTSMHYLMLASLPVSIGLWLAGWKLSYFFKACLLGGSFLFGSVMCFLYLSFYGISISLLMAGLLCCNVYLPRKMTYGYLACSICVIIVFAVLNTTGILAPFHDTANLFQSRTLWLVSILTFSMVFGLTLETVGNICNLVDLRLKALVMANTSLQNSLRESRDLRELIPICANCKKIRNDKGYWISVGQYLSRYPDNNVEENICPSCLQKEATGPYA